MKSFAILAATFAGVAYAQELPQPEGDCAQLCASNMNRIAQQNYSCDSDDLGCFCNESNWAYGIRDCSNEACGAQEALSAQAWAAARCAGVAMTASQTPDGLPILTSAVASASQAVGDNDDDDDDDDDDVLATTVITSVFSTATDEAGVPITSLVESASDAIASAVSSLSDDLASITSSVASELSDAIETATSDAGDTLSTVTDGAGNVISSATGAVGGAFSTFTDESGNVISTGTEAVGDAATDAADAVDGDDDDDDDDDEEGAAPMMTAAPLAAGLGLAAWLLV